MPRQSAWRNRVSVQGKADEAVRILETVWNGQLLKMAAANLGVAYVRAGRREDAERIAALVPRPISKATIFAALAEHRATVKAYLSAAHVAGGLVTRAQVLARSFCGLSIFFKVLFEFASLLREFRRLVPR